MGRDRCYLYYCVQQEMCSLDPWVLTKLEALYQTEVEDVVHATMPTKFNCLLTVFLPEWVGVLVFQSRIDILPVVRH